MAQSLVDQYREEFEKLKRQVEFMRSLLRDSGLLDSVTDTSKIDGFRQKLLIGFDKKKITKEHSGPDACRCCHYASRPNSSPLRIYDIAYLLVKNSDFQLLEPDWDNLMEENPEHVWTRDIGGEGYVKMYKCLFLGSRGCLYGQNRPAVCLSYLCDGAVRSVLGDSVEMDAQITRAVFKAIGLPHSFDGLGIVVSDWFYKVLLPKTGKSEQEIVSAFEQV